MYRILAGREREGERERERGRGREREREREREKRTDDSQIGGVEQQIQGKDR